MLIIKNIPTGSCAKVFCWDTLAIIATNLPFYNTAQKQQDTRTLDETKKNFYSGKERFPFLYTLNHWPTQLYLVDVWYQILLHQWILYSDKPLRLQHWTIHKSRHDPTLQGVWPQHGPMLLHHLQFLHQNLKYNVYNFTIMSNFKQITRQN